jgi:GNAT superfamily N-acetyltransferase
MGFHWHEEIPPRWDHAKARIIGGAPPGVFDFGHQTAGDVLAGQWWRAEGDDRRVVGYGWMDCNWGDGEILIAVDPEWQARGAGTFILERLRAEAAQRGVNYVYNIVPDRHPDGDRVEAWLKRHGFERHGEGRLLRARAAPPSAPNAENR